MDPDGPIPTAFGVLGTVSSFALAISPMPVICHIFRSKSIGLFRPDFFIIGTIYGLVNGTYTIITGQTVALVSSCVSVSLYSFYLGVYSVYAPCDRRAATWRRFFLFSSIAGFTTAMGPAIFGLISLSGAGSDWMDSRGGRASIVTSWIGVCSGLSIVALFNGQLTNVVSVVRNRDARSISLWMTLGGMFCSVSWTVYSALIVDWSYIVANLIGDIAGLTQIALKVLYRETPVKEVV